MGGFVAAGALGNPAPALADNALAATKQSYFRYVPRILVSAPKPPSSGVFGTDIAYLGIALSVDDDTCPSALSTYPAPYVDPCWRCPSSETNRWRSDSRAPRPRGVARTANKTMRYYVFGSFL